MRTMAKKPAAVPATRPSAPPPAVQDPKRFRRFGNITAQDMEIPALRILHALSNVVKKNPELEPGHFYHSILEEDLGDQLDVVVLLVHHSVVLKTPKDPRGKEFPQTLARAADAKNWDKPNQRFEVTLPGNRKVEYFTDRNVDASGLLEWGSSDPTDRNSLPAAQHVYTTIMRIIEPYIEGPVIYSGSVMTNKKIMQLNTKIDLRAAGGVEPLRQIYRLTSEEKTGTQGGNWFIPNFTAAGQLAEDDPLFEEFLAQAERLQALYPTIKIIGQDDVVDADDLSLAGANNPAF